MRIKEEIIGKEVIDTSGLIIGKVKDVEVNFETQLMENFIIGKGGSFGGFGMSKNEIIVPYDSIRVIGDKVLLKAKCTNKFNHRWIISPSQHFIKFTRIKYSSSR